MNNRLSVGLGSLTQQPAYARTHSHTQRYAARFYRSVIFGLTTAILLVTAVQYWQVDSRIPISMGGVIIAYLLVFWVRMRWLRVGSAQSERFYQPYVQFIRGQLSLLAVAGLMLLMAYFNLHDHGLWLLFLLATMIISEHNKTSWVLLTLVEVAALIFGMHYLGWAWASGGRNVAAFLQQRWAYPLFQVLGIWLVNFVFHYLMRNIHGRNKSYAQRQQWLKLVAEQWTNQGQPEAQRLAVLQCADDLTTGPAQLWVPRLRDGTLVNPQGEEAPDYVTAVGKTRHAHLLWPEKTQSLQHRIQDKAIVCPPQALNAPGDVRIIFPIFGLDEPDRLIGVLETHYAASAPTEFEAISDLFSLADLVEHARLVLIVSLQNEQAELEKRLAARLNQLDDTQAITRQIVEDVVTQFGFDIATVSLVDLNENLVRGVSGKHANWYQNSVHPLNSNDIQCLTVRTGQSHLNSGSLNPTLNRRIWKKYKHRHLTRIWVPIPSPTDPLGSGMALGTIEAGFRHTQRTTIPQHLVKQVESYGRIAGIALAKSQSQQEQKDLTQSLIELHQISREIQAAKAYYEPHQMIQLVSSVAQRLLGADIIMLYTCDTENQQLTLVPVPDQEADIWGPKDRLKIALDRNSFLGQICLSKTPYYQPDVRSDPNLVNTAENQHPHPAHRTFAQRQNVKSFAGIPLIGKSKRCIGLLCMNYRHRRRFSDSERQIIELFAEQATLAVEDTYQHRHVRTIAIAQERNNLGRELHNSLSQTLHGLFYQIKATQVKAKQGHLEETITSLAKTRQFAEFSLNGMENLLTHLHEQVEPNQDLVQDLQQKIDQLESMYNSEIVLEHEVTQRVPDQIQFYLLRIAWEALSNAVQHARCKQVRIHYQATGKSATLMIQDNGQGFDVQKARESGRYGLSAMDYFAHQLNSHLVIRSLPGEGTCIEMQVDLPT